MRFNHLFCLCILETFGNPTQSSNLMEHARKRRAAIQFHGLIQCHQPDVRVLGVYGDYGCFCGDGGVGTTPIDSTDRCCQTHDGCYKRQDNSKHATFTESILMRTCGHLCVSYSYTCNNESITCTGDSILGKALCECDKEAAKCFALARNTYDNRLANVDPKIWCNEKSNITELLRTLSRAANSFGNGVGTTLQSSTEVTSGDNGLDFSEQSTRGERQTDHPGNTSVHSRRNSLEEEYIPPRGNGNILIPGRKWIFVAFLAFLFC